MSDIRSNAAILKDLSECSAGALGCAPPLPDYMAERFGFELSVGLACRVGTQAHVLTDIQYRTYMTKRLTRSGNSLSLVIDRPLLEALDIDAETELELSTDGDVLVVTPIREGKRKRAVPELAAEGHEQYGGVFRRLAESASRNS